jgi:hypothetical protein
MRMTTVAGFFRRRAAGATAVAGLVALVALALPAPSPAAAAAGFANGNLYAVGIVAKVAPGVGGLALGTTSGVAVSELKDKLAQSQAQSFDLGLVGTSLTAEGCSGTPGALTPDQLPQPTRVDNRKGDAEASSDEVPIAGTQLGAGREHAKATKQPSSEATATTVGAVLDPLVRVNGGQAHAATRIVDNAAREATASVDANLDLGGGAVQLRGLHWDVLHRTGANSDIHGTFSMEGANAGGVPLPVSSDQLVPVQDAINAALKQTGIRIELPSVQHIREPADVIRVTPLRVIMQDTPLGALLLRPGLEATRAQKEQLFTQLETTVCQLAGALLVGDISISVLAGTGFLTFDIGGVEATTAEIIYTDPFGVDLPLPDLNIPGIPGVPDTLTAVGPGLITAPATRPALAAGPTERVCESTHPFHWPRCSKGAALPLGVLGVLLTGGVAFLDFRHQRRRLTGVDAGGGAA